MLTESEIKSYTVDIPNDIQAAQRACGCASATGSALVGECDTCGNITAIDLDDTPEHWKEMQYLGRTVKRLPKDEALALWRERGKRCDHKALIAELRARVAPNGAGQQPPPTT